MVKSIDRSNALGIVLVTAPGFDALDPQTGRRLTDAGYTIKLAGAVGGRTPADVAQLTQDVVGVIASADPFTAEVFQAARGLRVIARFGAGFDSVDLDAATAAGVAVTTLPGLNADAVAEHTIALMLAILRRLIENDREVRAGRWDRGGELTPRSLGGRRVGIVGFGSVGQSVARRLLAFDASVRAFDPAIEVPGELAASGLAELLEWADVLTLHAPLTAETRNLIGPSELLALGRDSILVNTARGGLVNEDALAQALRDGVLAGAGLDVFATEPPVESQMLSLPNVVLSPHIGGLSVDVLRAMGSRCVDQVLEVLSGTVPSGILNPDALRRPQEAVIAIDGR